jgi:hypothetical protein
MSRIRASVIVAVVMLVFAVGIWTSGGTLQSDWLRLYSAAVTVLIFLFAMWEYWLWRLALVQRMPSVPRDIRGTWKGELETFWKDETGTSPPRKAAYLVVRQSATRVSVVLLTDESRSASSLATVSSDGTTVSLDYMYLNWPDVRVEERSRMHHGSASLVVSGTPANRLRGRYWTNRDSRGELDFTARIPQFAEDYEDAARAFSPAHVVNVNG